MPKKKKKRKKIKKKKSSRKKTKIRRKLKKNKSKKTENTELIYKAKSDWIKKAIVNKSGYQKKYSDFWEEIESCDGDRSLSTSITSSSLLIALSIIMLTSFVP